MGNQKEDFGFVDLLKTCAKNKDLHRGTTLHTEILKRGLLDRSPYVASILITMYARCGVLPKAQQVLDQHPAVTSVVSAWNALISGYIYQGQGHEALNCFHRMQREGLSPNSVTFICILKACGSIGALDQGKIIHDEITTKGLLQKDISLGTALVNMYAKCGMFLKAEEVLDDPSVHHVVSAWNALISGYEHHGKGLQAIKCFEEMEKEGLSPNRITFICMLKVCGSTRAIDKGKVIHKEIVLRGLLHDDVVLGTALVDMYVKCSKLTKAQEVLDELPVRSASSWNALITGHVHQGNGHQALKCFDQMRSEGLTPNSVTFICILKACGNAGAFEKGKQIHNDIVSKGLLQKDIAIGTALVDMYSKCGLCTKAEQVLDELPIRNVISWNSLITGYAHQGQLNDVLRCFEGMQREGISPDAVTFISILKACGSKGDIDTGKQIHGEVICRDLLKQDVALGNALVDMYAKCHMLDRAHKVLLELPVRDVISWNTLITGYVQEGQSQQALKSFEQMRKEGIAPDTVTFICIVKACGCIEAIEKGNEIYNEIVSRGLLEKDVVLANALIDMFAKCGDLEKAQEVLDKLPARGLVSWGALITGYVLHGQFYSALACFEQMERDGLFPDVITFSSVLKACGSIGAIDKGEKIHDEIASKGLLEKDVVLGNALLYMYVKCGLLEKAQKVFDELPVRDVISWNVLIAGYAHQGEVHQTLNCFKQMLKEDILPDSITVLTVLNACKLSGLAEDAQIYFQTMTSQYGITPDLEHHLCMIHFFACAGQFDKAMSVIKKMPCTDYLPIWHSIMIGCKKWGNVQLGRLAFDHAVRLDHDNPLQYVLMANIYATAGTKDNEGKFDGVRTKVWDTFKGTTRS